MMLGNCCWRRKELCSGMVALENIKVGEDFREMSVDSFFSENSYVSETDIEHRTRFYEDS